MPEREALKLLAQCVRPDITGAKIIREPRERGEVFFTDLTERGAVSLTDVQRELIRRTGHSEADVLANIPERKKAKGEPPPLTDDECESLRRHGHDPRLVERMNEVRDFSDYKRMKSEVEGGAS